MTSKGNWHIELKENSVWEWVEDGTITVSHVSGKCNPSDIFTKEMRDGANFQRLRDSFMSHASEFLKKVFNNMHPKMKQFVTLAHDPIYVAQTASYILPQSPGMLDVLISDDSFRIPSAISHLCSAGRQILSHVISPSSCRS